MQRACKSCAQRMQKVSSAGALALVGLELLALVVSSALNRGSQFDPVIRRVHEALLASFQGS